MRDIESLDAEQILAVAYPEELFSENPKLAKQEYRQLIKAWHPDYSSRKLASLVIAHLLELYQLAKDKRAKGNWDEPVEKIDEEIEGLKRVLLRDGNIFEIQYYRCKKTDTGKMFIGEDKVLFEIYSEHYELYKIARKNIYGLTFASSEMACEFSRFLPEILDSFSSNNRHYLLIRKTPDQLLLSDVLEHFGGGIEPIEHIGWILNCLYNLCCYLEWSGISHNAIHKDNIFISPLRHDLMLLGGWCFSMPYEDELIATPTTSLKVIPEDILDSKIPSVRGDLELVKAVGKDLIGTPREDCPEVLWQWLLSEASESSLSEYQAFKYEVLEEAFGRPKFVDLDLSTCDLYS